MLRLRRIPLEYGKENIIFLSKRNKLFCAEQCSSPMKVEVHGGSTPIYGMTAIVDSDTILKPDELGLSPNAFQRIGIPEGSEVSLVLSSAPSSINSLRRKIKGGVLGSKEYKAIVNDITLGRYSKLEIAALEVAESSFITPQEVFFMSEAIADGQENLKWRRDIVVDEVSIGGVPGNQVGPIVTSIVIGAGMCMPKIAKRSASEPSGAVEVMETMCDVDLDKGAIMGMIEGVGGCIALCGGKMSLSPIDNILFDVEQSLGVGMTQQKVISIISQAISGGITHLVVDIPVGQSSIVRTMGEAMRLRKLFEYVSDMVGIDANVVITDGSEPIGRGIGPVLESRDIMSVLRCNDDAPRELREKALFIAGRVLEFDPKLRGGHGYYRAQEILDSGRALEIMNRLVYAQGKGTPSPLGSLTRDITASSSGIVESIDCAQINRIAMVAGAPLDKGAGVDLFVKVGDEIQQGEVLYRIHASQSMAFAFAGGLAEGNSGFKISSDIASSLN